MKTFLTDKFILLLVSFCVSLIGCSDECADYDESYAEAEADSAYFAYAESLEFMDDADSSRLKKDVYVYSVGWNAERVSVGIEYDGYGQRNTLYADVYGCRTRRCPEASSIVIHNEDYSYEELVLPPDFEVSKGKSLQIREDFESKTIDFQFHLKLKAETAYLSAFVEIGKGEYEHCRAPLNPGW